MKLMDGTDALLCFCFAAGPNGCNMMQCIFSKLSIRENRKRLLSLVSFAETYNALPSSIIPAQATSTYAVALKVSCHAIVYYG